MQIIPGFVDKASGWLGGPILGTGIDGALTLGADTTLAAGANVRHYTTVSLGLFALRPATSDNYLEVRATGLISGADSGVARISSESRGAGGTNAGGAACADSGTGARSGAAGAGAAPVRVYARRFQSFRITAKGGDAAASSSGVNNGANPDGANGNAGSDYINYRNTQITTENPPQAQPGAGGATAGTPGAGGVGAATTVNNAPTTIRNAWRATLHEFLWGPNVIADGGAADVRIWRSSSGASGGSGGSRNTNGGTVGCGGGGGGGQGASGAKGGSGGTGTQSSTAFGTAVVGATGGSGGGGGCVACGIAETAADTYVDARGGTGRAYADPNPLTAGGVGGTGGGGGGGIAYSGTKFGTGITTLADGGEGGQPGTNDGDDGITVALTLGAI